jgi:hypothetical protein
VSRSAAESVDWQTVQGYPKGALNRVAKTTARSKDKAEEKVETVEQVEQTQ